mmetsp:Transcript_25945/g.72394  ORF Transcript_25945/g.72394 Transcript_25945/m.72394 type:complete len:257 (+) Transcript_25945:548-1318(+)
MAGCGRTGDDRGSARAWVRRWRPPSRGRSPVHALVVQLCGPPGASLGQTRERGAWRCSLGRLAREIRRGTCCCVVEGLALEAPRRRCNRWHRRRARARLARAVGASRRRGAHRGGSLRHVLAVQRGRRGVCRRVRLRRVGAPEARGDERDGSMQRRRRCSGCLRRHAVCLRRRDATSSCERQSIVPDAGAPGSGLGVAGADPLPLAGPRVEAWARHSAEPSCGLLRGRHVTGAVHLDAGALLVVRALERRGDAEER